MANPSSAEMVAGPLVSIVMNCLNSERYLRPAIDSVYGQTYPNWEIIFWDNASTDGSAAIAQSYTDGRLRYFCGEQTVPLGHARNLAVAACRGEFIAFLDCDDLWLPEKLERQIPLFLADEHIGLVYSDSWFFNEAGRRRRLFSGRRPYRGYQFGSLLNDYLVSLETAMVRRSALTRLAKIFDERFNVIEEYDLFIRISLAWKVDFVPEVLAMWRIHGESWTWRTPDAFVEEMEVMLKDLCAEPTIVAEHGAALQAAGRKVVFLRARMLWRRGEAGMARKYIESTGLYTVRLYLLWLATFLPHAWVEHAYRFVTGALAPSRS